MAESVLSLPPLVKNTWLKPSGSQCCTSSSRSASLLGVGHNGTT